MSAVGSASLPMPEEPVEQRPEPPSSNLRLSYHLGMFLATNAIRDAYLVVDGPDCVFRKAEWIHGRHDWNSTLMDVLGNPRVVNTLMHDERVIQEKGEDLATRLRQVGQVPGAGVALLNSMPHVQIIGTQYDKIIRQVQDEVPFPIWEVPHRALDGDWLHGYAEVLNVLAENIELQGGKPDPSKVAIIGNLMDRTEEDHAANVRELERLCGALGLELTTVWLENRSFSDLAAVKDAGTIVSLPLGRKAARTLAQRTGARLVEAQVPFGAGRTERFLRTLARATDRLDRVQPFVDSELARIAPRLEWVIPHVFLDRKVAFFGSPDLYGGMLQIAEEVGVEVMLVGSYSDDAFHEEDLAAEFGRSPQVLHAPPARRVERWFRRHWNEVDLVIGNSELTEQLLEGRLPTLSFGFPSHYDHALFDRPHLGFTGWICFLDRMAQALQQQARRDRPPPPAAPWGM